ncbi:helix-turn-helix domain-containing protein [Clostridium perfringens]|nr:helix-turn-helix domain-containing protein [Clostridium perfringens]
MKLKSICELRGFDFETLSEKTGLSISYLYSLDNGSKVNPTLDILKKLKQALDVPIDYLIES